MFCDKCGKQVADNVKFCPACGFSFAQPAIDEPSEHVLADETKKSKKPLLIALGAVVTLIVLGVSTFFIVRTFFPSKPMSPEAVAEKYMQCMLDGDIEEALDFVPEAFLQDTLDEDVDCLEEIVNALNEECDYEAVVISSEKLTDKQRSLFLEDEYFEEIAFDTDSVDELYVVFCKIVETGKDDGISVTKAYVGKIDGEFKVLEGWL